MQKFSHLGVLVVLTFNSAAFPSFSGTKDLSTAIYQVAEWDAYYMPRNIRDSQAERMLDYWENMQKRTPHLSPSEDAWVTAELSTTGERLERVFKSKEFSLRHASQIGDACVQVISKLIDDRKFYADIPQQETFNWVKVASCYADSDVLLDYLRYAGLSDGRQDGAFFTAINGMILKRILNVTIPSSLGDAEGWTLSPN